MINILELFLDQVERVKRWTISDVWIEVVIMFSSPKLKAKVNSFFHFLSGVRLSDSVWPSVCNLLTFSISSTEPLDQFHKIKLAQRQESWNLHRSILRYSRLSLFKSWSPVVGLSHSGWYNFYKERTIYSFS